MANIEKISETTIKNRLKDFQHMSKLVNPYFVKEGIELSFKNYTKTLSEYVDCDNYDIASLYSLLKDINLWVCYLGEVLAITERIYGKYENMDLYYSGFEKLTPQNLEKHNEIKLITNRLKSYKKMVEIQYKMFKSCSYTVGKMYNQSMSALIFRTIY